MKKKLVYIGFAFVHHKGGHAGYHQIKEYLDYDCVIDVQNFHEKCIKTKEDLNLLQRLCRFFWSHVIGSPVFPWYAFRILWMAMTQTNVVFHFIYGENTFLPLLKNLSRRGNKFVCTFHQPYEWFQMSEKNRNLLKSSDAVILVGESELNLFSQVVNVVKFIPHGICTDFYMPLESIGKKHMLLTVGNWLRDYSFANKVYCRLLELDPNLQIKVVTQKKNWNVIVEDDRIEKLTNISDDELRDLYRQSSVLFLPLTRYTANNSLLEAGATGCNIIISSDYPDNSYIPIEYLTLTSMVEEDALKGIESSLSSNYNASISTYVREHYSWETIAKDTESFLSSL